MTVMRVGLNVEQLFHPAPGGIGRYTARLATLLTTLAPGDEVVGFAAAHPRSTVARISLANALAAPVVLPVPRPALYDLWHTLNAPPLTMLSRRLRGLDVVHAPSLAVPPRAGVPLVVTVHDAGFLEYPDAFTRRGRRFHQQGLRAAVARADRIITVSRAAADEIVHHTGVDGDRLRVIPNGVDLTVVASADVERVRHDLQLGDAPYVLWVGTQEPRKNVALLVRSFAEAVTRERLPHALVLAGTPGWLHTEASAMAGAADLGDRLRVLGPVDDRDLFALYSGAALFALPSRHEGFGLPVLEAMAQGTPVICTDAPALVEVAGGAAAIVAPDPDAWADALGSLLRDDDRRRALAHAGRARARELTWERCVAATRAVYEEARASR
jgi:glycosyltransferase involved in cell wall biosynthesis